MIVGFGKDLGPLAAALIIDRATGFIHLMFPKEVAWVSMRPAEAREMAAALLAKADELEGKKTT